MIPARTARRLLVAPFFAASVLPSSAHAQGTAPAWEPVTMERLGAPRDGDWLNYRRTYDVQGYSPLAEIDRTNVGRLQMVWSYSFEDNDRWVPTPVVSNGIMYVSEGSGRVTAMDAVTGDVVWIHDRAFPDDIGISMAYPRSRGVSVFDDKVYWGTADSYLVVLDARTGEQLWEVQTDDYRVGHGHSHPPLIADGKVLLGYTGSDHSAYGMVVAYDAQDGRELWRTASVPSPGEPAYDTWHTDETGVPPLGAATWGTFSYDPELRLLYVGTGQPTPRNLPMRKGGDALYAASILALDMDTGAIRWYFQVVPADSWDFDTTHEPMLVDLLIRGEVQKALIQTSKIGWGVVLDRATGRFLHAFRTGYDNVITGWTELGRPIYDAAMIPAPEDVDTDKEFLPCPYLHGARDLNAASFSPVTRLYYLGVNNSCSVNSYFTERPFTGVGRYQGMRSRAILAPGYDYVGEFVAFEPISGRRAWTYRPESGAPMSASALATAGGIVFGGTSDRWLFALNDGTGELLWNTRLNGDISGAPITYTVDGKQYVAVGAGGRIAQTTTLGPLVDIDIPRGGGVMWVFALPDSSER